MWGDLTRGGPPASEVRGHTQGPESSLQELRATPNRTRNLLPAIARN